jgi:N-acetylmuramoyl-L-alanine amidase
MVKAILLHLLFIFTFLCAASLQAHSQTTLDRISVAERSDGKGLVLRYHISGAVDSFRVTQPGPDLVQMMIYSQKMNSESFKKPNLKPGIERIDYHDNDAGFGLDIFLQENRYFKASAYPDRGRDHILLALENSSSSEISDYTDNTDFIFWYDYQDQQAPFAYAESVNEVAIPLSSGREFKTIVIDAGHGGHDPGAVNRRLGYMEKDIVLDVALKVGNYIKEYMPDVEVIYTRDDDTFVKLEDRGLTATRAKGDLFLSIHANSAANSRAYGSEIFFLGLARSESALEIMKKENSVVNLEGSSETVELSEEDLLIYELANAGNIAISERIASMIEDQFRNRAQRRSRGVKQAGFLALWHASTPAVLVELGFLSNPTEANYLASEYGQTILASAIFRAVRDFKVEYDNSMQLQDRVSNE